MQYKPNSNPENSGGIRTESLILRLTEHFVMNRAMTRWDGPPYTSYSTNEARLRSFVITNWPQGMKPAREILSAAGFSAP